MAIENLDFIRQLIEELRREIPARDMERLRMVKDTGMGTGTVENE